MGVRTDTGKAGPGRRRVVITGMGVVTGFGRGVDRFWEGVSNGRSAIRRMESWTAEEWPCQVASAVPEGDPAEPGRPLLLARLALREALEQAGFSNGRDAGLASAIGWDNPPLETILAWTRGKKTAATDLYRVGAGHDLLREEFGFDGPERTSMSACAASTQVIGDAACTIALGRADMMVAGGADSRLNLCGLLGYARLGALSTGWNRDPAAASRPFAADRDGFVMGEGAAFLVLEERERALRRGATVWAEVAGWASTCDAFRVTDPHPDGDGSSRCIELALASAGIGPESIDYINAHGTGTPANDRAEYRALRRVFGDKLDRTPVSSIKSMIGHFSMAAGSIEAICSAITLKKSWICPTLNAENLDPEFSGDFVVGRGRSVPVSWVLKNSFGFGGQNSCLVLRRADL